MMFHILNMLKIKCDIKQQDLKTTDLYFVKFEYSFEVVDRVSETQLQVGGSSDWIIWRLIWRLSKEIPVQIENSISSSRS